MLMSPKKIQSQGLSLDLSTPKVMGILNVTPDSFSDGGQFLHPKAALAQVTAMMAQGVDMVDIGAESTRPNAEYISDEQQLARLVPVVQAVKKEYPNLWLSIDTSSPVVIQHMHALGAHMWNDVRGLQAQGAAQMAADLDMPVVIMHHRGTPKTMDGLYHYDNAVADIFCELKGLTERARHAGVKKQNLLIDVGMGFAKQFDTHTQLMGSLSAFLAMGYPMVFGVSRKRFLAEMMTLAGQDGTQAADRDLMGAISAVAAVLQGASIIRTHNVAMTKQALVFWQACQKPLAF